MDCVQGFLYTEYHSRQTIDGCVCNGLMNTETDISHKLSFLRNPALICGTIMTAFVLNAMPGNAFFQSAFSNIIMARQPDIWLGGVISYHGHLLLIEGKLSSNMYVREVLEPEIVPLHLRHLWSYLSTG
ncbi:hypothetical protein TNCV_4685631 [Trichonephila clavipes]|nr:hypothetical protein TNCV_4685631 [Trichonephila clavipes]